MVHTSRAGGTGRLPACASSSAPCKVPGAAHGVAAALRDEIGALPAACNAASVSSMTADVLRPSVYTSDAPSRQSSSRLPESFSGCAPSRTSVQARPAFAAAGGRQTAVIRLHAAHGHQRVRPPGQRVSQQKFQLARLVAAQPRGVRSSRLMYSGPQPSALLQILHALQRRKAAQQRITRHLLQLHLSAPPVFYQTACAAQWTARTAVSIPSRHFPQAHVSAPPGWRKTGRSPRSGFPYSGKTAHSTNFH